MRNRTEGRLPKVATTTKTLEEAKPHEFIFDKARKVTYRPLRDLVKNPVVRQNPPTDFKEIAADLYPDFVGLDD